MSEREPISQVIPKDEAQRKASMEVDTEIRESQHDVLKERREVINKTSMTLPNGMIIDEESASENWLETQTENADHVADEALYFIKIHETAKWTDSYAAKLNELLDEISDKSYLNYVIRLNTPDKKLLQEWVNKRREERVKDRTQEILDMEENH